MFEKRLLRAAVGFYWVALFAAIRLPLTLRHFLPDPLIAYLASEEKRPDAHGNVAIFLVLLVTLIGLIVSSIGLMLLRRWARWTYLASVALACGLMAFLGPVVLHAFAQSSLMVSMNLSGFVIGISFFSNAIAKREMQV